VTPYPRMEKVDLERKFEANLLNSGIYLVSLSMHVSTFMVNYQVPAGLDAARSA